MKQEEKKIHVKQRKPARTLLFGAAAVVLLLGAGAGVIFAYEKSYEGKIYRGVKIAGLDVGGLTSVEALAMLEKSAEQVYTEGLLFAYGEKNVTVESAALSFDSVDGAYDMISYDSSATMDRAYKKGREGKWSTMMNEQLQAFMGTIDLGMDYFLNEEKLWEQLRENFNEFESPAVNASLIIEKNGGFGIAPAEEGKVLDYEQAVTETKNKVARFDNGTITLALIPDYPKITEDNIENAKLLANELLKQAPLTLKAEEKIFTVDQPTFASWLDFATTAAEDVILGTGDEPTIGLRADITGEYLDTIGEELNVKAKNGKFEREENGNIIALEDSKKGREINKEKSIEAIEDQVIREGGSEAKLVLDITEPRITAANVNELNIVEKIGEGRSNFAGSPRNRTLNIQHGTSKIHGHVIAPEEEFSLVELLKPFTLEDGWLEELVIKGNETKPEVAGGACQFGTTLFRGALNSGLDITSRRNHSYTVSYYFPIGTDATIYDPAPDFRFINDTGNYILLQARIEGKELVYEFWGKSDGRKAEVGKPSTYNWVDPPPRKTIETDELAPGETKCTEKAHKGVEARFDYKITYADGRAHEETFHSKYKPWQEVCLVGKDPNKDKPAEKKETPTNSNSNSNQNTNGNTNQTSTN